MEERKDHLWKVAQEVEERIDKTVQNFREQHKHPANLALHGAATWMIAKGVFRILRGRLFRESDTAEKQLVVVVDEYMATQLWPNEDAIGKRIRNGGLHASDPWMTVVGVAGRVKQSPDAAETAKTRLTGNLKVIDEKIAGRRFLAGDRPTIADCTLLAALEFGEFAGVPLDPSFKNVGKWYATFKERPSAAR